MQTPDMSKDLIMQASEPNEAQRQSASAGSNAVDWPTKARRSDQLLLRMNHEVRTAVNVILGLTEVMRESELSPNLRNKLSVARESAEHLLKESAEIIDLTRAELGSLQLCSTTFNLHETLRQAMDLMSILASCKRITLRFNISKQTPYAVTGDPGRLKQILITLLRACIDRLEQGEIEVKVEHDLTDAFKIKFSIADNGRPIPTEKIRSMFELDQEIATTDGSALAVLLATHLARTMGGDLWADEEPQGGAVFHFTAVLHPAAALDFHLVNKPGVEAYSDERPLKILVADDSLDTLMVIRAFLKDAPWGIDSADNGRIAVEMATSKSYDLILMDLDMPEMNGYIATREIRISECLKETPAVPIVALTAHSEAEAASKSIEAGCTAHVTKPIRKTALIETIQRYAGVRPK
jgi:CheY-like chemotaxis protein